MYRAFFLHPPAALLGLTPGCFAQAREAITRGARGGILSGRLLNALSSLLVGAGRIRVSVNAAGRAAGDVGPGTVLHPVISVMKVGCRAAGAFCRFVGFVLEGSAFGSGLHLSCTLKPRVKEHRLWCLF